MTMQKLPETRTEAVEIFEKWINQRPGLDARNYISDFRDTAGRSALRQEQTSIRKEQGRAIDALRTFEGLPYDPEMLKAAMRHAFSGRLEFGESGNLEYCTGQYFPTEYRPAAASCLEQYASDMRRNGIGIPEAAQKQHGETITVSELKTINAGHGGHFFDASTMRFFGSKVHGPVFVGSDGWYFVTSEQREENTRRGYTVRQMNKEGDVCEPEEDGHDNFQRYDTLRYAHEVARKLAERSIMLTNAYEEARRLAESKG